MNERRIIAEFSEYGGFIDALRSRVAELNVAGATVDEVAGYASGYTQKLLGVRQVKRLGMRSMGELLGALGLKAQLVEDPVAMARVAGRLNPRKQRLVHTDAVQITTTRRFLRKIGRAGGRLSRSKMSRRKASQLGRKAAMARWAKPASPK